MSSSGAGLCLCCLAPDPASFPLPSIVECRVPQPRCAAPSPSEQHASTAMRFQVVRSTEGCTRPGRRRFFHFIPLTASGRRRPRLCAPRPSLCCCRTGAPCPAHTPPATVMRVRWPKCKRCGLSMSPALVPALGRPNPLHPAASQPVLRGTGRLDCILSFRFPMNLVGRRRRCSFSCAAAGAPRPHAYNHALNIYSNAH